MPFLQTSTTDFILQMRRDFIDRFQFLIDDFHLYLSSVAGILVLIFVVYKVVLFMVNPDKGLDPYIIVRPCLILAGIVLYNLLVQTFMMKPMNLLSDIIENSILKLTGIDANGFDARFNSAMTSTDNRLYDILQINPLLELLHLLVYFVGSFVASYMLIKQSITIAIYYVKGYFSMIFSLIPGNEKSFLNWALSFLAILLWEPFILILKYLIILTKIDSTSFSSFFVVVAVQISSIFLFFKIPRFCELLINGGSSWAPHSGGVVTAYKRISSGISSLKSSLSSIRNK